MTGLFPNGSSQGWNPYDKLYLAIQALNNAGASGRIAEGIDPEREHVAPAPTAVDPYAMLCKAIRGRWPDLGSKVYPLSAIGLGTVASGRRRTLGLSQGQVARCAAVGRRFVSEFENGKPTIRLGQALQVMHALGLQLRVEVAAAEAHQQ